MTRFFFPRDHLLPSHIVGIISLVGLAVAVLALYGVRLAGSWRWIHVISAVLSLYLNVFVGVVQAFQMVPALKAMAPTQTEPPFVVAQLIVIAIVIVLGIRAVIRFGPMATTLAQGFVPFITGKTKPPLDHWLTEGSSGRGFTASSPGRGDPSLRAGQHSVEKMASFRTRCPAASDAARSRAALQIERRSP